MKYQSRFAYTWNLKRVLAIHFVCDGDQNFLSIADRICNIDINIFPDVITDLDTLKLLEIMIYTLIRTSAFRKLACKRRIWCQKTVGKKNWKESVKRMNIFEKKKHFIGISKLSDMAGDQVAHCPPKTQLVRNSKSVFYIRFQSILRYSVDFIFGQLFRLFYSMYVASNKPASEGGINLISYSDEFV